MTRCGWMARSTATLRRKAVADGARAVATIVHVAPDAERDLTLRRGVVRRRSPPLEGGEGFGTEAGASAWNGMLIARILAPDSAALRTSVDRRAGTCCGTTRPLPRVWLC